MNKEFLETNFPRGDTSSCREARLILWLHMNLFGLKSKPVFRFPLIIIEFTRMTVPMKTLEPGIGETLFN